MVVVENVTLLSVSTIEELNNIIQRGSERRHISGTQMNDESSRSHLILSVVIESTNLQSQSVARGKVYFSSELIICQFLGVGLEKVEDR